MGRDAQVDGAGCREGGADLGKHGRGNGHKDACYDVA